MGNFVEQKRTNVEQKRNTTPKKESFIIKHGDTLLDALYNAINTIKNKKEVLAQDLSKKYYRDFLRYNEALDALLEKMKK